MNTLAARIADALRMHVHPHLSRPIIEEALRKEDWEQCAHQLAKALNGAVQRHQITLSEMLGNKSPEFDIPPPSVLENIKNVAGALSTYRQMNFTSAGGPMNAENTKHRKNADGVDRPRVA